MEERPSDWPGEGPIDQSEQDLPHASASTEWWYLNGHLRLADERRVSFFAAFFRMAKGRDEETHEPLWAYSLTWALSLPESGVYLPDSHVDPDAARMGLEQLDRGEGPEDPRIRRALREVLERDSVPLPDRVLGATPHVAGDRLDLDYDGARLQKRSDGSYLLELYQRREHAGCELVVEPQKPPVRHGDDGVVRGHSGEDMFYYFVPRCRATGHVTLDGRAVAVAEGSAWFDHEFGVHRHAEAGDDEGASSEDATQSGETESADDEQLAAERRDVGWNWLGAQLDDGTDVTAYELADADTGEDLGQWGVLVEGDGTRRAHDRVSFEALAHWRSTRTFNAYPTRWRIRIPDADLDLRVEADFADQELITVISKPAFWEGRVRIEGTRGGRTVRGVGFVERSGFGIIDDLDQFFDAVSQEVQRSIRALLPLEPDGEQLAHLVAARGDERFLEGVDPDRFARNTAAPIRAIVDRGGKAWRSYAALACCDVVGGDSRPYVQWLAVPELLHVGSLIVDDVQDGSTWRRGGQACHVLYGESVAINAGTDAYFLSEHLLDAPRLSREERLRIYALYFEGMRAGHAGQSLDLDGLHDIVDEAVETGEAQGLEQRVLAVHRLKTAAPAGCLARMGAVAGGGSEAQIHAVGHFFEALGLAFQIVDDVLNLRGFESDLKTHGEDIQHGKVTLPLAKAMSRLDRDGRRELWERVAAQPSTADEVGACIERLEACGAVDACMEQARELVEAAWRDLDPLVDDSLAKLMLRAFGWYILERHY